MPLPWGRVILKEGERQLMHSFPPEPRIYRQRITSGPLVRSGRAMRGIFVTRGRQERGHGRCVVLVFKDL